MATATIRSGLLERLKRNAGIVDDESFARMIGTSVSTLKRIEAGEQSPSMSFAAGVAWAFGMSLGEVVTLVAKSDASVSEHDAA